MCSKVFCEEQYEILMLVKNSSADTTLIWNYQWELTGMTKIKKLVFSGTQRNILAAQTVKYLSSTWTPHSWYGQFMTST